MAVRNPEEFLSTTERIILRVIIILLMIIGGITILIVDIYGLIHLVKVLQHG